MQNEMAHYAADCWDCELLNSYGWIECVGCADRSAYDLSVHMKATGFPLQVREPLKEPYKVEEWLAQLDKKRSGPKFKKDVGKVQAALDALEPCHPAGAASGYPLRAHSLQWGWWGRIQVPPAPRLQAGPRCCWAHPTETAARRSHSPSSPHLAWQGTRWAPGHSKAC